MNKETLKALEGSIRKWERIADGTGGDNGFLNCPLCELFSVNCSLFPYIGGGLYRCPVYERTGKMGCYGTPYLAWSCHQINVHGNPMPTGLKIHDCPECKRLAEAELEFLKSLLPEMEKPVP